MSRIRWLIRFIYRIVLFIWRLIEAIFAFCKRTLNTFLIVFVVWLWGYYEFSFGWIMVGLLFMASDDLWSERKESMRKFAQDLTNNDQAAILSRIGDDNSWVYFPDVDQAEWINKVLNKSWPFIGNFVKELLMTVVQAEIHEAVIGTPASGFHFVEIDLGDVAPRIEGIHLITPVDNKDEIICDIDLNLDSHVKVVVHVAGANAGIRTLKFFGSVRIIIKPLLADMPFVGGISIFFLNAPIISFDLTAVASLLDMPGVNVLLRNIINKKVAELAILPNRIPISFTPLVDPLSLRYPLPEGVILLKVLAADELVAGDAITGGSDPYCLITIGAQSYKTKIVPRSLKPVWNETFELIVDQRHGQHISIEVFDHDRITRSDPLGYARLDTDQLAVANFVDLWLPLEDVKTGKIHLQAAWHELATWEKKKKAQKEIEIDWSLSILNVLVDNVTNLPTTTLGSGHKQSTHMQLQMHSMSGDIKGVVQKTTAQIGNSPVWQEMFQFINGGADLSKLTVEVVDSSSKSIISTLTIPLAVLAMSDEPTSQTFDLPDCLQYKTKIKLRLCVRLLKYGGPVVDECADLLSVVRQKLNLREEQKQALLRATPKTTLVNVTAQANTPRVPRIPGEASTPAVTSPAEERAPRAAPAISEASTSAEEAVRAVARQAARKK